MTIEVSSMGLDLFLGGASTLGLVVLRSPFDLGWGSGDLSCGSGDLGWGRGDLSWGSGI